MQDIENDGYEMQGRVKWFDPGKGFGFIVADDGGPDILLHANVLRNFGQSSVADDTVIEVLVVKTDRGLQAAEVLNVQYSDQPPSAGLADFAEFDPEAVAAAPIEPARVKWFDKAKGFGFANVFGSDADIFVHIEVLRLSGLADLLPGEAIAVRAIEGKRGLMAAEVLPWEVAIS
ncbi:cold shock domain-containing protein [Octadecabacter sp. 1_MG-2023]|uniref:cold-shock protein n=1 Tax=unclassified Octadecabacter TaxID=196158 RepID=UPI001C08A6CE|nr:MULTISPECIES: cold shock protein [unclassified Octadecabacter]MBU2993427.1 cold shock domain-containing protein [Octadecabacter sp. B2R22]MDO6733117.1 cold shock domain-containing protein [Octadecabacter sp. 1_MG-2023]